MAEQTNKPVTLKLNTAQFASMWAEVTIDRLHQALDKFNIGKLDGALWRSLQAEIVKSNGDVDRVITRFMQYGRFVDMGVGRGVSIGAAGTSAFAAARNANGTLKKYARKPKKWFSRTYYHEVQRFVELYSDEFSKQIPVQIAEALNAEIKLAA